MNNESSIRVCNDVEDDDNDDDDACGLCVGCGLISTHDVTAQCLDTTQVAGARVWGRLGSVCVVTVRRLSSGARIVRRCTLWGIQYIGSAVYIVVKSEVIEMDIQKPTQHKITIAQAHLHTQTHTPTINLTCDHDGATDAHSRQNRRLHSSPTQLFMRAAAAGALVSNNGAMRLSTVSGSMEEHGTL